jgi:hypothetical protein
VIDGPNTAYAPRVGRVTFASEGPMPSATRVLTVTQGAAEADKSALADAVAQAGELERDDYTDESWAALQDAVEAGEALLDAPAATQADVDAATTAILAAITGLHKAALGPSITVTATPRCAGSKAQLAVVVKSSSENAGEVDVTITSLYGLKRVLSVQPGKSASYVFAAPAGRVLADSATAAAVLSNGSGATTTEVKSYGEVVCAVS